MGKVTTSQLDITNECQEASPFPAGGHKASINRRARKHNKNKTEITFDGALLQIPTLSKKSNGNWPFDPIPRSHYILIVGKKISVYPGLLLIPVNLICHMTMFRKLNFWPLSKAPGGRDPKNCAGACAIHVRNSHTKSGWISGKKLTPSPPWYPLVPPLGMTQAAECKSHLICFISFICEKIHKVWLKNLWNWLCNID